MKVHDAILDDGGAGAAVAPSAIAPLERALERINRVIMILAALALVAAALVLTESVVVRYVLKASTDWQDEACIMLLVAATFLSAAHVQARRGHVGIEAFADYLSPAADRWRRILIDVASFLFCAFFAWKSWTLTHEAWVDGQVTTSTVATPLWIPYSAMAAGMTLLVLQIGAQIAAALTRRARP